MKTAAAATSPNGAHHVLEDILRKPWMRTPLRWMTASDENGTCLFERICENYENARLPWPERLIWSVPSGLINLGLSRVGLDKEMMKKELFRHHPTVRALSLTARSIAGYGLTTPQRFAAPLVVVWNITQACNLRCKHCYQDAGPRPADDELTLAEKIRLVDEMAAEGVPFLAIAGGEPLVCNDLWPVLDHASRRGIHLSIATNGTLLTPATVHRLIASGVKYTEVSVDSLNPEEHDVFRGAPGAWARSIDGVKNCVAAGMHTGFAMCFTGQTVDQVDDAVRFAIALGCATFSHFDFIPAGRGNDIIDCDLTPEQRERLMQKLTEVLQEGRINVISTAPQFAGSCIPYWPPEGIFATGHVGNRLGTKTMVLSRYIGGCGAGRYYCAIQPNGDVTPCVYPGFVLGRG